jgi:superoxide dismutase
MIANPTIFETKKIEQMVLPYPINGLEPVISQEKLETFYKNYDIHCLNQQRLRKRAGSALASCDMKAYAELIEDIKLHENNFLNHQFVWLSLCPLNEAKPVDQSSELFKGI